MTLASIVSGLSGSGVGSASGRVGVAARRVGRSTMAVGVGVGSADETDGRRARRRRATTRASRATTTAAAAAAVRRTDVDVPRTDDGATGRNDERRTVVTLTFVNVYVYLRYLSNLST